MIQRKIRVDLAEYDDQWKDCFVLFGASSFRESIEFKRTASKIQKEMFLVERELKKVKTKLDLDASVGRDSDEETFKLEAKLAKQGDKLANEIIEMSQKFVQTRFISGQIFDTELNKMRALVREDILDFDEALLQVMIEKVNGEIAKKN